MLRVMIVDDEPNIVEGLCHLVQALDPENLDVVKAYSGSEALAVIGESAVDLVLSDIRMPGMTGLQLLGAIENYWPACRVIFLTGYGEFESAQAAVNSPQCAGYLLKTEGDDVVLSTVARTLEEIERNQENSALLHRAQQHADMIQSMFRAQYLRDMLSGSTSVHGQSDGVPELHINLNGATLPIVGWLKKEEPLTYQKRIEYMLVMDTAMGEEFGPNIVRDFALFDEGITAWLLQPAQGIGEEGEPLLKYIRAGLQQVQNNIRRTGVCMNFALGSGLLAADALAPKVQSLCALAQRMRYAAAEILLTEGAGQSAPEKEEDTILRVKQFVERNISDKTLSLSRIAAVTYYNPSYFSRFFKQVTGSTLSDFINEVRLSRALELLNNREIRISEIASRIGLESPSYFTMFFKKRMGITPNEYRASMT